MSAQAVVNKLLEAVRPCVRCGYCCTQGPCPHGDWDKERGECAHLTPERECGRYAEIKDDPMFGGGCSSTLFNTVRDAKIARMKGRRER
jgi:hypothetical protein